MPTYVVFSRLNADGWKTIRERPERMREIEEEVRAQDGKVVAQWMVMGGEYDFCSIVEAPDNRAIHRIAVNQAGRGRVRYDVMPAMDLPVFQRLLSQTTETAGPHKWQIGVPAQVGRRALRYYSVTRHVRKWCEPLVVDGKENLKHFKGPGIVICNHSSHLDSLVVQHVLPGHIQRRLAFGGAADRWFIKGRKGITKQPWWNSLSLNIWPIQRGGGRSSLAYGEWLLDKKWNLMIFPEGTRTTTGKMSHFKHGVSIIALAKNVPVIPVYVEGLRAIRPKGSKAETPGPVTAVIGKPIHFPPGTEVPAATDMMYRSMQDLRERAIALHPKSAAHAVEAAVPEGLPAGGS